MRWFSFFPRNEENYKDLCRLELRLPGHVMSWTVETRKRLFASDSQVKNFFTLTTLSLE